MWGGERRDSIPNIPNLRVKYFLKGQQLIFGPVSRTKGKRGNECVRGKGKDPPPPASHPSQLTTLSKKKVLVIIIISVMTAMIKRKISKTK